MSMSDPGNAWLAEELARTLDGLFGRRLVLAATAVLARLPWALRALVCTAALVALTLLAGAALAEPRALREIDLWAGLLLLVTLIAYEGLLRQVKRVAGAAIIPSLSPEAVARARAFAARSFLVTRQAAVCLGLGLLTAAPLVPAATDALSVQTHLPQPACRASALAESEVVRELHPFPFEPPPPHPNGSQGQGGDGPAVDTQALFLAAAGLEKLCVVKALPAATDANGLPLGLQVIGKALDAMRTDRVLPYRFIAAAQYAPDLEPELEHAMFRSIEGHARLPGKTRLLVDVSGSMDAQMSAKSEMRRLDAACGLAVLAREIGEDVEIFTFSNDVKKVAPRRGFALRDAIVSSQPHGGTELGKAIAEVDKKGVRLIVFTDEQSHDAVPAPKGVGYMVNVASYQHGVGHGPWRRIDGFSEKILDWIISAEQG